MFWVPKVSTHVMAFNLRDVTPQPLVYYSVENILACIVYCKISSIPMSDSFVVPEDFPCYHYYN